MSSETLDKWHKIQDLLHDTIVDSEGMEILCSADHESKWELGMATLLEEIMNAMGEGDVEPWTPQDRLRMQIETLEREMEMNRSRLDRLRAELNK